ncbi:MAG: type 1 glutamine amidotransferase [Kiloniellales bacterium]
MSEADSRVLYIVHKRGWTDSRVADVLRAGGLEVEFRCHAAGDPLPPDGAGYRGVVIGGGPHSVYKTGEYPYLARELDWTRRIVEQGTPTFGICLGAQIMAYAFGGEVAGRADGLAEFGFYPLEVTPAGKSVFGELRHVFQSHYESCTRLPADAERLAGSEHFANQAFSLGERAVGVQFHPDARLDMIPKWYAENGGGYDGRLGVQGLEQQLRLGPQCEAAIQTWLEGFIRRWLDLAS